MLFRTTYAQCTEGDPVADARKAAEIIKSGLAGFPAAMVVFFSSIEYDPETLARAMHEAFPGVDTLGCTTTGEAVDDRLLTGSVVAMAFAAEVFDYCETAVVVGDGQEPDGDGAYASVDAAMAHIGRGLKQNLIDLSYREYVGFILAAPVAPSNEAVLERLGEVTDVIFVGGFAGEDYKFNGDERVFFRGRSYRSAAVIALWKPRRGFSFLKTQAVNLTEHAMIITRADEDKRIIWELDGEPAASLYARLIGTKVEALTADDFDNNPLAWIAEGDPFLRPAIQVVDGKGLRTYAAVRQGTRVCLTHTGDILNTTAAALQRKMDEEGPFSAVLHINCASRYHTLDKVGQTEAFGKLFAGMPSIAFSSYGEVYVGMVAMTSTMILFK